MLVPLAHTRIFVPAITSDLNPLQYTVEELEKYYGRKVEEFPFGSPEFSGALSTLYQRLRALNRDGLAFDLNNKTFTFNIPVYLSALYKNARKGLRDIVHSMEDETDLEKLEQSFVAAKKLCSDDPAFHFIVNGEDLTIGEFMRSLRLMGLGTVPLKIVQIFDLHGF